MVVGDTVRRSAPSVREHTALAVAADALVESGLGTLPVLDRNGLLTGVVSEGDLLRFAVGTRPDGAPRTHPTANRDDASPRRRRRDDPRFGHRDRRAAARRDCPAVRQAAVADAPRRAARPVGVVTWTDVVRAIVGAESTLAGQAEPFRPPPG